MLPQKRGPASGGSVHWIVEKILDTWDLPAEFAVWRRLLESRMAKAGSREYVGVLRQHEGFGPTLVHEAVKTALSLWGDQL